MPVAALIGVMIAIVVGLNLISPVQEVAQQATSPTTDAITGAVTPAAVSGAASSMLTILPIIFVAVIILGAISWMGLHDGGTESNKAGLLSRAFDWVLRKREATKKPAYAYATGYAGPRVVKNPRDLVQRIESASQKWGEYLNNLDELLGIKTITVDRDAYGLTLTEAKELYIDEGYDWFMADKAQDQDVFKIVGLHKKEAGKNRVYLLGKNSEGQPFLLQLPNLYIDAAYKCDDCITWAKSTSEEYKKTVGAEPTGVLVGVGASGAIPTGIYVKSDGHLGNWMTENLER